MLISDKINNLVPKAMEAIRKVGIANNDDVVAKEFEGYIASFGPNIIQSGLLPTLIFFQNTSGKKKDSSLWLDAIRYVMSNGAEKNNLTKHVIKHCRKQVVEGDNYQLADMDQSKLNAMEKEILLIVAALKLAVRTFTIKEG
ncbi:MAG: CRISPR-associated protein (Cas_Cmr5) [Alphaproteobacteria bacterium ADurb.Bin438]|nr:MAG: CRISPR-associated protein (Cas_Cmr5) [Alphaproteobacteria bacterium ADurb.Bin438]